MQKLYDLFERGKYEDVLYGVSQLQDDNYIDGLILKAEICEIYTEYIKVSEIANEIFIKNQNLNKKYYEMYAKILRLSYYLSTGKFNEFIQQKKKIDSFFEKNRNILRENIWKKLLIKNKITNSLRFINSSQFREELKEASDIGKELNNTFYNGLIYLALGKNNLFDISTSLDHLEKSLSAFKSLNNKFFQSLVENKIGDLYSTLGESAKGINIIGKNISLTKELNFIPGLTMAYITLGSIYNNQGELLKAYDFTKKALEMANSLNFEAYFSIIYNNLGVVLRKLGKLDEAFFYFEKMKNLVINNHPFDKTMIDYQLGQTYNEKGDIDKALSYFQRVHEYYKSKDKNIFSFGAIERLIIIYLSKNNIDKAEMLLSYLKDISDLTNIEQFTIFRVSEARIFLGSKRLREKMKAESILRDLYSKKDQIHHHYLAITIFLLSEILLDELKLYGQKEVLEETKLLIEEFFERAQNQHYYSQVVNSLILKSKLSILEGELEEASSFLNQGLELTREKGLGSLENFILEEKKVFETQLDYWKDLILNNASQYRRIEELRLRKYIQDAQKYLH